MTDDADIDVQVFVQALPAARDGREIAWGKPSVSEHLEKREGDIRRAIERGTKSVAAGISKLPEPEGWGLDEVSAKFGTALTASAGALITQTSVGATLEVTVKFVRRGR